MTKISGILNTSPRIEAGDFRSGPPLRPGSASFGQPVAKATKRPLLQIETDSEISADLLAEPLNNSGRKSENEIVAETNSAYFSGVRDQGLEDTIEETPGRLDIRV